MDQMKIEAAAKKQTGKCHFGGLFIQFHLAEASVQQ